MKIALLFALSLFLVYTMAEEKEAVSYGEMIFDDPGDYIFDDDANEDDPCLIYAHCAYNCDEGIPCACECKTSVP
uniref:Secretory peptide n=1 Tax=Heteropoda venatoria TaxID=152925 RepID=A0A088BPD3_HETVE|nr:secretory peptide [Heteropoda venatoria]